MVEDDGRFTAKSPMQAVTGFRFAVTKCQRETTYRRRIYLSSDSECLIQQGEEGRAEQLIRQQPPVAEASLSLWRIGRKEGVF